MTATVRAARAKTAKPLILCVEDDQGQLQLLKRVLQEQDFRVLAAATAEEGLRLFRKNPVSLIVIDQRLGEKKMTGAQLAREIKALKPNIPVVLRSGFPPGTMSNWDCFVNKGEPVETLIKIARDLIQRSAH